MLCLSQEAKLSFLIADSILVLSLVYIQYGIKKTGKEISNEGVVAQQQQLHEMDKTADLAQKAAQRAAQKAGAKHNGAKQHGAAEKHFNIQQPSKR